MLGLWKERNRVLLNRIQKRTRNYLVTTKSAGYFFEYYKRLDVFNTQEIEKDEERDSNKFFGSGRFYG